MEKIENYAIHIQEDMYIVATDKTSTSPISISGSSSKNGIEHWIYAVNLIYRCLVSGIWTIDSAPYMPSWLEQHGLSDHYDFCKKLSEYSPFIPEEENMTYWLDPLLCNTDFGQSFIDSFGLDNLKKNKPYRPFIDALEKLFHEKCAPWEAGDLFGMNAQFAPKI